jgi:hypothetical protein
MLDELYAMGLVYEPTSREERFMKRFAMILVAAALMIGGTGVAMAQHGGGGGGMGGGHGGGGGGMGGGWHGGGGGSWGGGGGNWHGGGGSWHGGGGSWHGGGGSWHGGHGGWGWHGTSVVIGVGGPWWGWWPAYYPYYYGGGYAYPYYYPYTGYYPYYQDAPMYDSGTYVQRPDAGYQGDSTQGAPAQGGYQYYCPNPAGYYPQVPTCAAGWLRVVPPNAPGPTAPR